jgi:magnesium chelatase subunit D
VKVTMTSRVRYPFAAVLGNRAARRALLLLAVEPRLRGALIAAESGSAESALARSFGSLLPHDENRGRFGPAMLSIDGETNLVQLPLGITEDSLLGGLELEQTLATGKRQVSKGLLARANGRVLYVDDANLLEADTAAHVAHALDCRQIRVEREGVSAIHDADFMFLATFNPAEGEPSAQLADRVALVVNAREEYSTHESVEMIDRAFRFDTDPFSFVDDFAFETAEIKSLIEAGRAQLPRVRFSKDQLRQIALVATRLGVKGNRADVFTLKAARASAALAGRDAVSDDDLIVAIQLVLAPRATTLPSAREDTEEQSEVLQQDNSNEGIHTETDSSDHDVMSSAIEDLIVHTIDAQAPEDLFPPLHRPARASRAGKRFKAFTPMRGRYVRSAKQRPREARVAIDATLRAAAPFQLQRGARADLHTTRPVRVENANQRSTRTRTGRRVKVEPSDLRYKGFKHRSGALFIFAVDASGSMALNRMAQAKGALTRLLGRAYLHRDKVALISFRGKSSEILLAPTRSVELAKRLVDALPAGGGTPISAAVVKALELARAARIQGMPESMLVLFTDGRANVGLREGRSAIRDELSHLGQLLRAEAITSVVVDTKSRFVSSGEAHALAQTLGSRYLYLPRSDAATVYDAITSIATEPREP